MTNFTCPNCGLFADDGASGGIVFTMVSTIFDEDDPWSGVLQRSTCPECDTEIQNHHTQKKPTNVNQAWLKNTFLKQKSDSR